MAKLNPLRIAFKEWAVICKALAQGRQALILRKGGIAESHEGFRVEHSRFWLYPTYVHQQQAGICEAYRPLLAEVEAERPPAGRLRLQHFAEVTAVERLTTLQQAEALAGLHGWSADTVIARFHYREPGLYALFVRLYRVPTAWELEETPAYAGCKSWVELDRELPTTGAVPVLSDEQFAAIGRVGLRERSE
jgi:hypothetical protein